MSGFDEMERMVPYVSAQLLPCPFCGRRVYLKMVRYKAHGKTPRFFINHRGEAPRTCPYHRWSNTLTFVDPREALNKWNRRAS